MEQGYPYDDIPKILKYCPQLTQHFTIEQIAIACLAEHKLFKATRQTIYIRPFVSIAVKNELNDNEKLADYVEHSIAICANDSMLNSFIRLISQILVEKGLD